MLKFTGLTYDQFTDQLYLAATVLKDNNSNSDSWGAGKHVLFAASFEDFGAMADESLLELLSFRTVAAK